VMVSRLERLGVRFDRSPEGTFYCWGNLSSLPAPLNDGMSFFKEVLEHKVIVVPGEFFDVNPGKRRHGRSSRFRSYVRFSFGPSMSSIETALERIEQVVNSAG
jgi:N-succinyldiaminopimelate aminotransferase